jgi:hypothetical protein
MEYHIVDDIVVVSDKGPIIAGSVGIFRRPVTPDLAIALDYHSAFAAIMAKVLANLFMRRHGLMS